MKIIYVGVPRCIVYEPFFLKFNIFWFTESYRLKNLNKIDNTRD